MSQTFQLVCHETKRWVWIGQGRNRGYNPLITVFYTGDPEVMADLKLFFQVTMGKPLVLICNDITELPDDYHEFGTDGTRIGVAVEDSIPIPDDPDGYHTVEVLLDSGNE